MISQDNLNKLCSENMTLSFTCDIDSIPREFHFLSNMFSLAASDSHPWYQLVILYDFLGGRKRDLEGEIQICVNCGYVLFGWDSISSTHLQI